MKPSHIIPLLLVSVLPFGCGKEAYVAPSEGRRPISFTAGMQVMTKADKPNDPTVLLTVGNEASIFGTRVEGVESELVLGNLALRCDEVPDPSTPLLPYSSVWNYSPVKYWQDTGDYYFTSVFPYSSTDTWVDNTYYLNVRYLVGSNTDLMVARAIRDASVSQDPVNLTFKHVTSAVRFLFGKASDSASDNYALSSFQLENIAASGTFKVMTRIDPALNPISSSNWTYGSYSNIFSWTADNVGDRQDVPHPSDSDDPDDYLPMGWYYMVPQTLSSGASIRFSVSYNGENPVETVLNFYGATDQMDNPGLSWAPNQVYNYYITLTQSGLELTVRTSSWDEVQVTTDDISFEG